MWGVYSRVVCGCVYLGFFTVSGGLGASLCLFQNVMLAEFGGIASMYLLSICKVDLHIFDKYRLFVALYVFEFLELMACVFQGM